MVVSDAFSWDGCLWGFLANGAGPALLRLPKLQGIGSMSSSLLQGKRKEDAHSKTVELTAYCSTASSGRIA